MELPTDLVVGYLKEFGRTVESIVLTEDTNSEIIEAVRNASRVVVWPRVAQHVTIVARETSTY